MFLKPIYLYLSIYKLYSSYNYKSNILFLPYSFSIKIKKEFIEELNLRIVLERVGLQISIFRLVFFFVGNYDTRFSLHHHWVPVWAGLLVRDWIFSERRCRLQKFNINDFIPCLRCPQIFFRIDFKASLHTTTLK